MTSISYLSARTGSWFTDIGGAPSLSAFLLASPARLRLSLKTTGTSRCSILYFEPVLLVGSPAFRSYWLRCRADRVLSLYISEKLFGGTILIGSSSSLSDVTIGLSGAGVPISSFYYFSTRLICLIPRSFDFSSRRWTFPWSMYSCLSERTK